jgi:hypothetical protein
VGAGPRRPAAADGTASHDIEVVFPFLRVADLHTHEVDLQDLAATA